jgi:hypothetical protein
VNEFILIFLTIASALTANAAAIEKFSPNYPYNLLTPGYSIVTEGDLAYDNYRRKIGPYNPSTSLSELYWQCWPTENIKAGFNAWVGNDGMGPHDALETMCALNITVRANNEVQTFTDRRAHQIHFCFDFTKKWKQLTKDQKFVCLDGEGGSYHDEDKNVGRSKLWTWDKFKTKKGCYSFFAGDCDTSGCEKSKGSCRLK